MAVVHHVELCVKDRFLALDSLRRFGFRVIAKRKTPVCEQILTGLGEARFLISERVSNLGRRSDQDFPSLLCCEEEPCHSVDTVFNVALNVRNVSAITSRIRSQGGTVVIEPTIVNDEFGEVTFSVVRSCVGNVVHTLLNRTQYKGQFLPGFVFVSDDVQCPESESLQKLVTHIDHVTLACTRGDSVGILDFYEACFGMQAVSISRDDDQDEGLIIGDGVGLRLRAMEYFRCSETALIYPPTARTKKSLTRNPKSVMIVVVESLPGQTDCNVETFLREHHGPGVEHIAVSTTNICQTVGIMNTLGCHFRKPPKAYYRDLKKVKQIEDSGENLELLGKHGILLDTDEPDSEGGKLNYLMQIFAHPIFSRQTFFIEVIHRSGSLGLGTGNILDLMRSIREEQKTKITEAKENESNEEIATCPRKVC